MEPMSKAQRAIFDALPEVQKYAASERKWRSMTESTRKVEASRQELASTRKTVAREAEVFRVHHPIRAWLHDKGLVPSKSLTDAKVFEDTYFEKLSKLGIGWATPDMCERNADHCTLELDRMAVDPLVRAGVEKIEALKNLMEKQAQRFLQREASAAKEQAPPARENVIAIRPKAVDRLREITVAKMQAGTFDPSRDRGVFRVSDLVAKATEKVQVSADDMAYPAPGM